MFWNSILERSFMFQSPSRRCCQWFYYYYSVFFFSSSPVLFIFFKFLNSSNADRSHTSIHLYIQIHTRTSSIPCSSSWLISYYYVFTLLFCQRWNDLSQFWTFWMFSFEFINFRLCTGVLDIFSVFIIRCPPIVRWREKKENKKNEIRHNRQIRMRREKKILEIIMSWVVKTFELILNSDDDWNRCFDPPSIQTHSSYMRALTHNTDRNDEMCGELKTWCKLNISHHRCDRWMEIVNVLAELDGTQH